MDILQHVLKMRQITLLPEYIICISRAAFLRAVVYEKADL